MRVGLAVAVVAVALGACAKPHPAVVAQPAVLQVPSPPPRIIVPPEPEPEPEPAVDDLDKSEPKPRRPAPRTDARAVTPPKPGETAPATVEPPKQVPPVPPAAGTLQPVLPSSAKEVEAKVREQLDRARADLGKVDYQRVSADARAQYDMAQRFIEQAKQALVDRNLVFAGKLAEKAGNIAAGLAGR